MQQVVKCQVAKSSQAFVLASPIRPCQLAAQVETPGKPRPHSRHNGPLWIHRSSRLTAGKQLDFTDMRQFDSFRRHTPPRPEAEAWRATWRVKFLSEIEEQCCLRQSID